MGQILGEEHRKHERVELNTHGELILPGGFRQPVRISDMSLRGAAIKLQSNTVLPGRFTLHIQSLDGQKVKICKCERRWQKGTRAGVRFLSAHTEKLHG